MFQIHLLGWKLSYTLVSVLLLCPSPQVCIPVLCVRRGRQKWSVASCPTAGSSTTKPVWKNSTWLSLRTEDFDVLSTAAWAVMSVTPPIHEFQKVASLCVSLTDELSLFAVWEGKEAAHAVAAGCSFSGGWGLVVASEFILKDNGWMIFSHP